MPFKKGKPKTGGRTAGVLNGRTQEQLKRVEYVLGLLDETINEDIKALDPKDRAKLWQDLQEYIRPKLARVEQTGNTNTATTVIIAPYEQGSKNNDKP